MMSMARGYRSREISRDVSVTQLVILLFRFFWRVKILQCVNCFNEKVKNEVNSPQRTVVSI